MTQRKEPSRATVPAYVVDTLGAPFKVTLINSVIVQKDASGEEKVSIPDVVGLINAVVYARAMHDRKLSGSDVKFMRTSLGVKAKTMADYLDVSAEHLSRCEAGSKVLSDASEKLFRMFAAISSMHCKDAEDLAKRVKRADPSQKSEASPHFKGIFEHIFYMKIRAIASAEHVLHFEFSRGIRPKEAMPTSSDDFAIDGHLDWKTAA